MSRKQMWGVDSVLKPAPILLFVALLFFSHDVGNLGLGDEDLALDEWNDLGGLIFLLDASDQINEPSDALILGELLFAEESTWGAGGSSDCTAEMMAVLEASQDVVDAQHRLEIASLYLRHCLDSNNYPSSSSEVDPVPTEGSMDPSTTEFENLPNEFEASVLEID